MSLRGVLLYFEHVPTALHLQPYLAEVQSISHVSIVRGACNHFPSDQHLTRSGVDLGMRSLPFLPRQWNLVMKVSEPASLRLV